jgi:hypothetical protein
MARSTARHSIRSTRHSPRQTHVDNSFGNSFAFTENNVMGSHVLIEAAKNHTGLKRFIHVSTDEVRSLPRPPRRPAPASRRPAPAAPPPRARRPAAPPRARPARPALAPPAPPRLAAPPRPPALAPRPSPLAPRPSPLAPHPSPHTPHPTPHAPHPSPLTLSPLTRTGLRLLVRQ